MEKDVDKKQLRNFGLIVGGIFGLIAVWPLVIRAAEPRWWAMAVAAALLVPALVYPNLLKRPQQGWMAFGHILGWINTRIILGLIFYVVVTPIGIVRRWLGKDSMDRRFRPDLESYRVPRKPRPASHLNRQY